MDIASFGVTTHITALLISLLDLQVFRLKLVVFFSEESLSFSLIYTSLDSVLLSHQGTKLLVVDHTSVLKLFLFSLIYLKVLLLS